MSIKSKVIKFLEDSEFKFQEFEPDTENNCQRIHLGIQGENTDFNVLFNIYEPISILNISVSKIPCFPVKFNDQVAKLLLTLNLYFNVGTFAMDYERGGVHCIVSSLVSDNEQLSQFIQDMFSIAVNRFDDLFPNIMKIVYGGASVEDILKEMGLEN